MLPQLLFLWVIIQPWTTKSRALNWRLLFFFVSADVVNTMLAAFLALCDRPVYDFYLKNPNLFGVSPLQDQVLGAVLT